MSKPVICLLGGGQSTEHEVSLISATNVYAAIDKKKYDVLTVGINKDGDWFLFENGMIASQVDEPTKVHVAEGGSLVFPAKKAGKAVLQFEEDGREALAFDVLFPVLHGRNGEDGAVQGLAQLLNCPCVGCGMTSSAICMDKAFAKEILEHEGIRTADWRLIVRGGDNPDVDELVAQLGLPLFVKPANAGSSVGVVKVTRKEDYAAALAEAMKYDSRVLVERAIVGREIECAVIGNMKPFCSEPGEIVMKHGFYSYDAKYNDADEAELVAPAPLAEQEKAALHDIASRAYLALGCKGMARVDFFFTQDGQWILNEINTIPGFTKISMYPRLMGLSGLDYGSLVDKLIALSLEK